jgi:hypothetical protein
MSTRSWDCVVSDDEPLVDFSNAYSPAYTAVLEEIERTRTCPFSQEGLACQSKEVLAEAGDWFSIECTPHYRDRDGDPVPAHFLFVSKKHGLWVPGPGDMYFIGFLMERAQKSCPQVSGWALAGRLSPPSKSEFGGQSIRHNHLHFFASNTREDARTPTGQHSVAVDFGFF